MDRDSSPNAVHRVSSLVSWVVLAILAASAIYISWIAIVNWKHIGV